MKKIHSENIKNTATLFELKDNNGIVISKIEEYVDINNEPKILILIGNENMFNNLKDNQINQYFFDCTYKMVPPNKHKFKLMVLIGYNLQKTTVLCLFVLIANEKEYTFKHLFTILKEKYSFNPRNIMCDFSLGQINAVRVVYPECRIHCCFFHFSQAIWRKFKENRLCGQNTYEDNNELLFNIQIMCFMKRDKIDNFYKQLKKIYNKEKYKDFFIYFSRTWMGKKYPKILWNFNDIINGEEEKIKNFYFTNNLCENVNRYLNSYLRRGICSNFLFRTSLLSVIDQFANKTINDTIEKKKSDILKFYIEKNDNPKILSKNDINELKTIYDEVKFININKDYVEKGEGELDIINYEAEDDSD